MRIELCEIHDRYSLPHIPGIYFIFGGDALLYIRMSNSIATRLTLSRLIKEFLRFGVTHFYVFPYYEKDLHKLEQKLIEAFDPPVNKLSITARPKNWLFTSTKRQSRKVFV